MSSGNPSSLFDKFVGGCLAILLATIAIYCAVQILQEVLPWLIALSGAATLIWIVVAIVRLWIRHRY